MKTQVKKAGNSLVIRLNKEFLKYYNLKEGDWVDLSDIVKCSVHIDTLKEMTVGEIKKLTESI